MGNWWSQSDVIIEPGDLIEIFRDTFQHWAVYVGDGDVVHLTSPPGAEVSGAASKSFMSVLTEKAMVRKQKLKEVVGDNKWRINNNLDKKYEPRPSHIIVKEALGQVGKTMEYSIYTWNCEHFVNKLRYGIAISMQARVVEDAGVVATVGALVVGALTIAAGLLRN